MTPPDVLDSPEYVSHVQSKVISLGVTAAYCVIQHNRDARDGH